MRDPHNNCHAEAELFDYHILEEVLRMLLSMILCIYFCPELSIVDDCSCFDIRMLEADHNSVFNDIDLQEW